ncbi:MAG: glycogen-binding domain-containing protein [Gemmatimonadota bacterium]|nr:glycogen-binding domain-containing protein [Gemmatimonadota bacterium]
MGTSGVLACALMAAAAPATAQRVQSSIAFGGVSVRYDDAVDLTALSVSPALSVQAAHALLAGFSTLSSPTTGGWSAQGQLAGSGFSPALGPASLELTGVGGGSTHSDGTGSGQVQLIGRAHASFGRAGTWLGAGAGRVWDGVAWRASRTGEVGTWFQLSDVGVTASYTPTALADTLRYADTQLSARFRAPRIELDAFLGLRRGSAAGSVVAPEAWGSLSASVRMSSRVAVVASGGTYPPDLMQGLPSGRFTFLGLRITGPGSNAAPAIARSASELARERATRAGLTGLRVREISGRRYEIRVRAPAARTVEISGDFTGWSPVSFTAEADGWWVLAVPLAPGSYEMNVRLDGGAWLAPPGLPARRDEFGGVSAILTVH